MLASRKEDEVNDLMEIELLAILRGLKLCVPLGLHVLVVESDSLLIVNELLDAGQNLSLLGNLFYDVKELLKMIPRCSI